MSDNISDREIQRLGQSDPVRFVKWLWPHVQLYDKERMMLESIRDSYETYVVAGNMLGKDYTAGLAAITFFLTRHPVRIVTTSADHPQLEAVLWGEIRKFLGEAKYPLLAEKGGPIIVNHLHLKKRTQHPISRRWRECPLSYCIGRVSKKGEGLLGHHIADIGDGVPRTLFMGDEASGLDDEVRERAMTWAKRMFWIGNPYPPSLGCTFFEEGVELGDLTVEEAKRKMVGKFKTGGMT